MYTDVRQFHGVPTLFINGSPEYANAYISYLEEHARYTDFSVAGIHIYSVPVYLATRGINTTSGIGPFRKGLWDHEEGMEFILLEKDLQQLLAADPDALIFPRIMLDMPEWWDDKYPDELNRLSDGKALRQSFSSNRWREDAGWAISQIINYLNQEQYREHIIGYQLSAGTTEEWFYHGFPNADYSEPAKRAYHQWSESEGRFGLEASAEPSALWNKEQSGKVDHSEQNAVLLNLVTDQAVIDYRQFLSFAVTDVILYFTQLVKELTDNRLVVGVFYGYSLELTDPRSGHHDLQRLLGDKSIDFLCSPNSYMEQRRAGCDWPFMSVTQSIQVHHKLLWMECDTRTFLTQPLREARPAICPPGMYEGGVWEKVATRELTLALMIKNFGRCLTTGTGYWWFDMWGGWFADPLIMEHISQFQRIGAASLSNVSRSSAAEIAVFVDEKAYSYLRPESNVVQAWTYKQRLGLGLIGAPYDMYDISDLHLIRDKAYKLVLFLNTVCYSSELEAEVRYLENKGMSICWTYAPGMISLADSEENRQATLNIDNMCRLTGMKLRQLDKEEQNSLSSDAGQPLIVESCEGSSNDWKFFDVNGFRYGLDESVKPILVVDDSDALPLGRLSGTTHCGFAMKEAELSKTFFSSAPDLPASLLRAIAQSAGVHLYVLTDDVIYANANYVCIHAAEEGMKQIELPHTCRVSDAITGEVVTPHSNQISVQLSKHETKLFILASK